MQFYLIVLCFLVFLLQEAYNYKQNTMTRQPIMLPSNSTPNNLTNIDLVSRLISSKPKAIFRPHHSATKTDVIHQVAENDTHPPPPFPTRAPKPELDPTRLNRRTRLSHVNRTDHIHPHPTPEIPIDDRPSGPEKHHNGVRKLRQELCRRIM
jgi:hypothetical protein